jgi:glutamine amidotransferase
MITIIDYEAGNLRSVHNAFEAIGQKSVVTSDPADLARASAIVLPGVGAFGDCIESIRRRNLMESLSEAVLVKKVPFLGICLGMQFLSRESHEMGIQKGFGWIDGTVRLIEPNDRRFRVPHIGWNDIQIKQQLPLFEDISEEPVFYFVHSYHFEVADNDADVISATTWHGATITASVQKENIFGVQFHPEKSQADGLKLMENFVKLI